MMTTSPASPNSRDDEARLDGRLGLGGVGADEHALAGGQPVGLDHQRVVAPPARCAAPRRRSRGASRRRWPRRRRPSPLWRRPCCPRAAPPPATGPNTRRPCSSNRSAMPSTSGASGPTTVRSTSSRLAKSSSAGRSSEPTPMLSAIAGGAGVAGRAEDPLREGGLGEGMDEGVLSAAAAHHEHAHVASEGGSRCRRAALPPARPDARKSTRGGPVGEGRRRSALAAPRARARRLTALRECGHSSGDAGARRPLQRCREGRLVDSRRHTWVALAGRRGRVPPRCCSSSAQAPAGGDPPGLRLPGARRRAPRRRAPGRDRARHAGRAGTRTTRSATHGRIRLPGAGPAATCPAASGSCIR